jgi:hypothetical protein
MAVSARTTLVVRKRGALGKPRSFRIHGADEVPGGATRRDSMNRTNRLMGGNGY